MAATILRAMRVTMLCRNTFTHQSRAEKEARSLTEAGYAVTIVADGDGVLPAREEHDAYTLVRVPRTLRRFPVLRFFAHRRGVIREMIRTHPDILHAHDTNALEPVAVVARRLHLPFIYDAHDMWLKQIRRDAQRWPGFLQYYGRVERRYIPEAAEAITVSQPIVDELSRTYGRPFKLVPNYPVVDPQLIRRELRTLPGAERIPAEAPVVLRLGNLTPGRGVEQLVEAMCEVSHAHLVLLGRGSSGPGIGALAERLGLPDRVHLLAPVPEPEVVGYAASADVGVSPAIPASLNDAYSLPNKLFQYMAAGIPVVASDFPHLREIVSGSGAGVNVDATRADLLAAALRDVLADREAATEMGRRARQAVLERYNWTAASRELLAAYAAALGRPS